MAPAAQLARRRRRVGGWVAAAGGGGLALLVALLGAVAALLGGDLGCVGGGGGAQPAPSHSAERDIPAARLRLYRDAGRRYRIDWAFLASIGAQECGHGRCRGDNGSGCGGPMQIAVRRRSPCSPGAGPTLWERYGVDADHDGRADPNDPADAIFTAARVLRAAKRAPAAGGSYTRYRRAACNYYGACGDAAAPYADEVMARAVQYGFRGAGAPEPSDPGQARPALAAAGGCGGESFAGGELGRARRASAPGRLARLPADVTAGGRARCDARVVPDVVYLARRFAVLVTACYAPSGHTPDGEHPLGAAIDAVPKGGDWNRTLRLARALGWRESCALSGLRPACARPPFRFIGYNGFPNHGDPLRCFPCAGGAHIHVSWQTSASPGQPGNRARFAYAPAEWIEVRAALGQEDRGG
jgi:hypothetical protein